MTVWRKEHGIAQAGRGTMAEQHHAALVRRAVEEIWNQGDLALADALFAPTYVNHGGLIPDLVHGPEAIKVSVALYRTAFPDLHISVVSLVMEDALVALQWVASRTPPARSAGGVPVGQSGTLTGTTLSRFAGGQVAESWTRWDSAEALGRLGRVAQEGEPGPHRAPAHPPRAR